MAPLQHEHSLFLFLDRSRRPIGVMAVSQGRDDHVSLPVDGILATAKGLRAAAMIVVHNHPSGVLRPSREDMTVTAILMQRTEAIGIVLLDHWLVAGGRSRSILQDARQQRPIDTLDGAMVLREWPRSAPKASDMIGPATRWQRSGQSGSQIQAASDDAACIRAVIEMRCSRTDHLSIPHMGEPAWDILLDIYACQLEGVRLPVTAVGLLAGIPSATAQRWIKRLTQQGMLMRIADPQDRRRAHVTLSPETWKGMRAWHEDVRRRLSAC